MKRAFDVIMSAIGLIVLLPIIIVVSIVIKLTSPGKVIFSQRRLTKNMREFSIYKFRSMTSDTTREKEARQIKGNSVEITPIGKIIRKTKLDEIPQLWNILRGDMSFVGPRPELPRRLKYYTQEQKEIFKVSSGITSPASIIFSNEEYLLNQVKNPEEFYIKEIMPYKIELNRYYVKNQNIFKDMWLILATILKIFGKVKNNQIIKDENLLSKRKKIISKVGVKY